MLDRLRGAMSSPPVEIATGAAAHAAAASGLKAAVEAVPPPHPYFPLNAQIAAGYLANEWNTFELVSMFAAGCAGIFALTYLTVKTVRPNVGKGDLVTMLWFVLCECSWFTFSGVRGCGRREGRAECRREWKRGRIGIGRAMAND